jgi:hypothetical protein
MIPTVENTPLVRQVRMKLSDLFRDPRDGMMSVVKSLAVAGGVALLAGFLIQAKYRDLEWMDYIGFAVGMSVMSGAPIASSALGVMAPRLSGAISQTPTPASAPTTVTATTEIAVQPPKS